MNRELTLQTPNFQQSHQEDRVFSPESVIDNKRSKVWGVTIDRRTSYDLDDAFSLEPISGGFLLSIHISDVASVVPKSSHLDELAFSRVASFYHDHYCVQPMFPRQFTKESLSLLPGSRHPTVSIQFPVSYDMEIVAPTVQLTSFKNKRRLDYSDVPRINKDRNDPYRNFFIEAERMAYKLSKMRTGSRGIYNENDWGRESWDPLPKPETYREGQEFSNGIVNEFMLLANTGFLRHCFQNDIPLLYRNHSIHVASGDSILVLYRKEKLRQMKQEEKEVKVIYPKNAVSYGVTPLGHFGMDRGKYTSFSSPGRKYSDLVNQRNTVAFYNHEAFPHGVEELYELAEHINSKERS